MADPGLTPEEERELAELEARELATLEARDAANQPVVGTPEQEAIDTFQPGQGNAHLRQFAGGAAMGLAPYTAAGLGWLQDKVNGREGMGYDWYLQKARESDMADQAAYPNTKITRAIGGATTGATLAPLAGPTVAGQGALAAGLGTAQGAAESGGDPVATLKSGLMSGALGAVGGKLAANRVARATPTMTSPQVAQQAVGRGATGAAPPSAWQTAAKSVQEAAPAAMNVGRGSAYGAAIGSMTPAGPGVGGALGAGTQAFAASPRLVKAGKDVGVALADTAGVTMRTPQALAGSGIPQGAREALEPIVSRRDQQTQHGKVQQAYVSGRMSPKLKQQLQPAIESGSFDQLATKLRALAADPELAGEIEKWMKGRSQ